VTEPPTLDATREGADAVARLIPNPLADTLGRADITLRQVDHVLERVDSTLSTVSTTLTSVEGTLEEASAKPGRNSERPPST